jgi:hypothetical protein
MTGLRYYSDLAREAAEAVRLREEKYAALVKARGQQQADLELRVWRAIASDWHWVVTLDRPDAPSATLMEKIHLLTLARGRADQALARTIAKAPDIVRRDCTEGRNLSELDLLYGEDVAPVLAAHGQRDRIDDLLDWYQCERPGDPRRTIAQLVELNLALRAQAQQECAEARAA